MEKCVHYCTQGFAAESASYFEATLQFQPDFEPAAERLQAVRCISLLKHIQVYKNLLGVKINLVSLALNFSQVLLHQ